MDLDDWNAAIFADVRARGQPGQLLYLFVDRELLGRLGGLPAHDAVADFSRALQRLGYLRPFGAAAQAAERWQRGGFEGLPGFVAHLAMTVLAVTEEPLGRPNGIYRRQNELLGLHPTATEPPHYGDDVPVLWAVWNAWLNGPGARYGRSSARTRHPYIRQGWARSQGLIRHTDRERVEQFFAAAGGPGEHPPSAATFVAWLHYRGTWGADLLRRVGDEAALEVLQDVLNDEAERWRRFGPRQVSRGRRARLIYDGLEGSFGGALTVDESLHGVALDLGEGEPYLAGPFDLILPVTTATSPQELLTSGVEHRVTDTLTVTFGGEDVYVMADDPSASGLLQCTRVERRSAYSLLVREVDRPGVATALSNAGTPATSTPSFVSGWCWFDGVVLEPGSTLLSILGLAASPNLAGPDLKLAGGLRVGPGTYLTGGEPDIVWNSDTDAAGIQLDDLPIAFAAGQTAVSLAAAYPDPGEHRLVYAGRSRAFRTVEFQRDQPGCGEVWQTIEHTSSGYLFNQADRGRPVVAGLSGAAIRGVDTPEPLAIRRPENAECIVITDAGDVRQVWPTVPPWLRAIGLQPASVDVLYAVRTMPHRPVGFVVRSGQRPSHHAVVIPPDTQLQPGRVRSRPRREIIGELVTATPPLDARIKAALRNAFGRSHNGSADQPPRSPVSVLRADVFHGRRVDNPFDDVLTWLSELEHGRVSQVQYAETWMWACMRYGHVQMAAQWRRSLQTLTHLGHIERDFDRQEVAVAPAVLAALPAAAGLFVLAGARPIRLLERMEDPDDVNEVVAVSVSAWALHFRTPLDRNGLPAGPAAVYAECDVDHLETVRAGLRQLGVTVQGLTATQLLDMVPSLEQVLAAAPPLLMSPSRKPELRTPTVSGVWTWTPRDDDHLRGLYCYRVHGQRTFAWRPAPGQQLVAVPLDYGEWLARNGHGRTTLLSHDPVERRLLVHHSAQLPSLVARALCLRTGLPARMLASHANTARTDRLAFDNVDDTTARHVAHLLQQHLQHVHDT